MDAAARTAVLPTSARAQFQPRPLADPATGERYHIEAAAGLWFPTAHMSISSESLGILGSTIDFKRDLALTDQRFPEVHLELRPTNRHKFRFQFIPIKYEQTGTLTREIVFNGQRYRIGVPVKSTLDWKAYRIGYEFDFSPDEPRVRGLHPRLQADRRHGHARHRDARSDRVRAGARRRFRRSAAWCAATSFPTSPSRARSPGSSCRSPIEDTSGHYFDVDIYGTLNFTNYVGVQVGYRSFDVGYLVDTDTGSFTLKGMFFGIVARY